MAKKTEIERPSKVTGVQLKRESATKAVLTWVNNSSTKRPYSGLYVELSVDGKKWKQLGKVLSKSTTKLNIAIKQGHKYKARVRPKNSKGFPVSSKKYPGGWKKSGSINNPKAGAPKPVSNLKAKKNDATSRIELRWKNNEATNREYDNVFIYVKIDDEDDYEEVSSSKTASYIYDAVPGHTYRFRIEAHNDKGFSSPVESESVYIPPLKPIAPKSMTAERESDNRIALDWVADSTAGREAANFVVERSVDGGAWSSIAEVGAVEAMTDTGAYANHSYRYRVYAKNATGTAGYAYSDTIVTTPAAPGTPVGDRLGDGTAKIAIPNTARNVTYTEVQRYEPEYDAWAEPVALAGRVTSWADASAPTDSAVQYRARNVHGEGNGALCSPWSALSGKIVPKGRPKAPTLVYPDARAVVRDDGMTVEVSWRHNPVDGSAQTAAQVRITWGGRSAVVAVAGAASRAVINLASLGVSLNQQLEWAVRTRGAYRATAEPDSDNMSPWSEARAMTVCRAPSVAFVLPSAAGYAGDLSDIDSIVGAPDGTEEDADADDFGEVEPPDVTDEEEEEGSGLPYALVTDFPLAVRLDYSDDSGELAQCTVTVSDSTGAAVYVHDMGDSETGEITRHDWAPQNRARYTFEVSARSTSTLSASATITVLTDFELPKRASLEIEEDRDRGWLALTPRVKDYQDGAEVDGIDIWRVVGSEEVRIAHDLVDGQTFIDRYAPLNADFSYRTAVYSRSGTYRTVDHPGSLRTPYAFFYYGESIARGIWNPEESFDLSRSRRYLWQFADREYPVLFDGGGKGESRSFSFHLESGPEVAPFVAMMDCPSVVYKSLDGRVMHCAVDVSGSIDHVARSQYGDLTVKITRVDGDAL